MAGSLSDVLFGDNASADVTRCLSRLELEGSAGSLYAVTAYDGSVLTVTAANGSQTWTGQLTAKELAEMAKEIKMSSKDFITETLKALTREKMGSMAYVYSTRACSGDRLQLSWKRCLKVDNIKLELGSLTLVSTSPQTANSSILDFAVETIRTLNNEIILHEEEKSNLRSEWERALSQLETCAQLKENLEKDLYGKFTLILNDKKSKIRRLMDQLSHLSEERRQLSESRDNSPTVLNKADDHVERNAAIGPPPKFKVSAACGSLLDHGQPEPTAGPPLVKRRRREPCVPSRSADIPRPPPLDSSANRSFNTSKRSSVVNESIDSDELLDLL